VRQQQKPITQQNDRLKKRAAFESMRAIWIGDITNGLTYSMPSQ